MQRLRTRRWALIAVTIAVGGGALATVSVGAVSAPMVATRYELLIDGYVIASFSDLKAVTSEMTPVTTTSTDGVVYSKTLGAVKPAVISLKRGLTQDLALSAWHQQALAGAATARRNATLVAVNADNVRVARWFLESAWPAKLEVNAVTAGAGQPMFETVTLSAQTIKRSAP